MKNVLKKFILQWLKCHLMVVLCLVVYPTQAQANKVYKRTLQWNYGGYTFTNQITINYNDYIFYKSLSKKQPKQNYATEKRTHPYLLKIAKILDKNAKELGYSGFTLAEYIIAFVQQAIPYRSDPYNYGWDYPKYPIETIVEQGGDCEDKAALTVALLKTFGFDAVLVQLPGHIAAAIYCNNCNGYYNYKGKRYAFIETTNKGWKIGEVPNDSKNTGATIIETASLIKYKREKVYSYNVKYVKKTPFKLKKKTKPNYKKGKVNVYSKRGTSTSKRNYLLKKKKRKSHRY